MTAKTAKTPAKFRTTPFTDPGTGFFQYQYLNFHRSAAASSLIALRSTPSRRSAFTVVTAFTLIELLVVIAIISLLAAVLFPVFAQAREKARQAACVSNTRQIAAAILMYSQDHDEALPPVAYEEGGGEDKTWPEIVRSYVRNSGVFLCPSDSASKHISYGLNELAFVDLEDDPSTPPVNLAQFQTPSTTVMLGDMGTGDDYQKPVADVLKMVEPSDDLDDADDARPAARHFQRVSLSFLDGHVKPMRLGDFYINQQPLDRWFTP